MKYLTPSEIEEIHQSITWEEPKKDSADESNKLEDKSEPSDQTVTKLDFFATIVKSQGIVLGPNKVTLEYAGKSTTKTYLNYQDELGYYVYFYELIQEMSADLQDCPLVITHYEKALNQIKNHITAIIKTGNPVKQYFIEEKDQAEFSASPEKFKAIEQNHLRFLLSTNPKPTNLINEILADNRLEKENFFAFLELRYDFPEEFAAHYKPLETAFFSNKDAINNLSKEELIKLFYLYGDNIISDDPEILANLEAIRTKLEEVFKVNEIFEKLQNIAAGIPLRIPGRPRHRLIMISSEDTPELPWIIKSLELLDYTSEILKATPGVAPQGNSTNFVTEYYNFPRLGVGDSNYNKLLARIAFRPNPYIIFNNFARSYPSLISLIEVKSRLDSTFFQRKENLKLIDNYIINIIDVKQNDTHHFRQFDDQLKKAFLLRGRFAKGLLLTEGNPFGKCKKEKFDKFRENLFEKFAIFGTQYLGHQEHLKAAQFAHFLMENKLLKPTVTEFEIAKTNRIKAGIQTGLKGLDFALKTLPIAFTASLIVALFFEEVTLIYIAASVLCWIILVALVTALSASSVIKSYNSLKTNIIEFKAINNQVHEIEVELNPSVAPAPAPHPELELSQEALQELIIEQVFEAARFKKPAEYKSPHTSQSIIEVSDQPTPTVNPDEVAQLKSNSEQEQTLN